ncbi:MAG: RsmB/NOP family class I SAM-dependent RNA methyltransferase [Lachnospiraceae bacterium]|nr:RsmB/NOP family class I SAM-dependent RNA methyltransferase [Lachnospiraceae bacterium]
MNVPARYLQNMQKLLGDEFDAYVASFSLPVKHGLRINLLKENVRSKVEGLPFVDKKIPFADRGYFIDAQAKASLHPYYAAGLYYLQEPSAMLPSDRLPIEEGDLVLDLCAAPGGKATDLLGKLNGSGILLANDISASRVQALLKNLELAGGTNYLVCAESPSKLATLYPETFDKILVDAPCSGEGMFRRDPSLIKDWESKGPAYYTGIQQEILRDAVSMLKPGGMLLYSTCTFSLEEDEDQILKLLAKHQELHPVPVAGGNGLASGFNGLGEALRVFPHKLDGEGHFLILLQKEDNADKHPSAYTSPMKSDGKGQLSAELKDFLSLMHGFADPERIVIKNGHVYLMPKGYERIYRPGIRFLRTGLLLGELDPKGHFKSDQALAMALKPSGFENVIRYELSDPLIEKYLRGETLPYEDGGRIGAKGDVLICVEDYPLGFAKINGNTLKNRLRPGFRRL